MERALRRLTKYASYLYNRPWQWWGLLALGLIVLSLLVKVVRTRRRYGKRPEELTPSEQARRFRGL